MRVLSALGWNCFSPAVCVWVRVRWIDGGEGCRFLLCPNIHFSIFFSALHSSSAGVSFFLHPLTVFPHRYSCFLQHFEPLLPQHSWDMSQEAAHPPSRFSVKITWRRTTESIKRCGKGQMGSPKYLSWSKPRMNDERVSVFVCYVSWDGPEQGNCPHMTLPCSSASHFDCSLHFHQSFHMIPTSSHPPPLQSVSLPVTLILLRRLLAG